MLSEIDLTGFLSTILKYPSPVVFVYSVPFETSRTTLVLVSENWLIRIVFI